MEKLQNMNQPVLEKTQQETREATGVEKVTPTIVNKPTKAKTRDKKLPI